MQRFVARRVRPEHVDDLVQDMLLRIHEHAGQLRDPSRLPGWAFRVAQSVVADHHRRKRPEVTTEVEETQEPVDLAARLDHEPQSAGTGALGIHIPRHLLENGEQRLAEHAVPS